MEKKKNISEEVDEKMEQKEELNINEDELDKEFSEFNLDNMNDVLDNIDVDNIDIDNIDVNNIDVDNIDIDNIDVGNIDVNNIDIDNIDVGNIGLDNIDIDNIDVDNIDANNIDFDDMKQDKLDLELEDLAVEDFHDLEEELNMNDLLTKEISSDIEEEFDMNSLLTDKVSDDVEEEKESDLDSLLSEEIINGLEQSFDENGTFTEEAVNEAEEQDLLKEPDNENTEEFSLDSFLNDSLDFSVPDEENKENEEILKEQDSILENFSDILDSSLLDGIPDAEEMITTGGKEEKEEKEEKKKGFFEKLFGNVKDDKWEKQKALELQKEEEKRLKEEEKKNAEEKEKEVTKEEVKAEKKAKKEEKKAAKKAAKEQAKKEKEERKAQQKQENVEEVVEDEGRINKVGASIVFAFFAICAVTIVMGTNIFSYNQSIKNATNLFDVKKYTQAYEQIRGVKIKSKDEEIYNKIMTVMYVDKQLNSYNNYYGIKLYSEALDSLLKGLDKYDKHLYEAKQLGIKSDFDYVKEEILAELGNTFEISEQEAYDMLDMKDKEEYSEKVRKIANGEE